MIIEVGHLIVDLVVLALSVITLWSVTRWAFRGDDGPRWMTGISVLWIYGLHVFVAYALLEATFPGMFGG